MSGPFVDPGPAGVEERRASPGGAVGVLLGLALLGGAIWFALRPGAELVDPAPELGRAFALGALPFGLELEGAARLADGELVVAFAGALAREAPAAAPAELLAEDAREEGAAAEGQPKVDWSALAPLEDGAAPARVFLVRWSPARADEERRRLFEGLRFRDARDLGARGGRALLAREDLAWDGLAARAVRERHYHLADGAPTFVESVRVDLARPAEPWMLIALWPPRRRAALEPVRELLEVFTPR